MTGPGDPQSGLRRSLVVAVKVAAALLLLGLLVASDLLDLTLLRRGLASPVAVALGAGLVALNLLGTALRFWWLVRSCAAPIGLGAALRICLIGNLFNIVLLGGAGGDVARVVLLARRGEPKAEATATVLVDRLCGLAGLMLLVAVAVVLVPDPALATAPLQLVALLALLGVAGGAGLAAGGALGLGGRPIQVRLWIACSVGLALGPAAWWWWQSEAPLAVIGGVGIPLAALLAAVVGRRLAGDGEPADGPGPVRILARLSAALRLYLRRPGVLLTSVVLSAAIQIPMVIALVCFIRAMGLPETGLGVQFVAAPMALLANVAPLPMGGLGGGEAAYALILGGGEDAVPYASAFLMLRVWLVVLGALGTPALFWGGPSPRDAKG